MIQSSIGHLAYAIRSANAGFYKDLFTFLGWQVVYDDHGSVGLSGNHNVSLWFMAEAKPIQNDYDGPGLNHLAISVSQAADVDVAMQHLAQQGISMLFDTPRHRPEFAPNPASDYYQIMFESPDRILFEIVYMGLKEA